MDGAPASFRIVIADDHDLVREGLRRIVSDVDGCELVGEARNGMEAIAIVRKEKPDIVLLDSGMPVVSGIEAFGEIRRWVPAARIAVITGFTGTGHLSDWITAKVDGLLLKSCPPAELRKCIRLLNAGETFVSPAVLEILEGRDNPASLTVRELQVLNLIADGLNNAQIGDRLSVSPKTVNAHRTNIMAKLDVHSAAQLLAFALREGLLDHKRQQ